MRVVKRVKITAFKLEDGAMKDSDVQKIKRLVELGEKAEDQSDFAEMINTSISVQRSKIYQKYPLAKPDVIEGLLLLNQCFQEELFKRIDEDVNLNEEEVQTEMIRFAVSFQRTLKRLYGP